LGWRPSRARTRSWSWTVAASSTAGPSTSWPAGRESCVRCWMCPLRNARALAALLSRLGREEQPQSLFDEFGGKLTIEGAASALAARGFEARVVRATGRELMLLQRPTLVELAGGDIAILTDVRGRE